MTTMDMNLMTPTIPKTQVDYIMAWRELWENHVYWTRFVVVGIVDNVPGLTQAVDRLMTSCMHMRDLLRPYYGDAAADKFGELMMAHLNLAAQLVTEASQGKPEAEETERAWYRNADEIAAFIGGANPFLPEAAVAGLLDEHLRLTKDEAVKRITKDYDGDIVAFDKIEHQILGLSDTLADGIIKQFPDKFQ